MIGFTFTKSIELTYEDLSDILCACIEGGSNYWAQIQNYGPEWDEAEDGLPEDCTIEDHIMNLWSKGHALHIVDLEEDEEHEICFADFIDAIQSVIDDCTWSGDDVYDVDGKIGDRIMQYATFGEVIYG